MFDLTECNSSQRKAVLFGEGPLLLLAGPGSGKTFTITKRILYLIRERQIPPERILVITFTREAALSMKYRFEKESPQDNTVNFGTFHSVFYHILLQSGRVKPGNILNDRQKTNLIFPILKQIKNDKKLTATELSEVIPKFLRAISYYKNTGEEEVCKKEIPEEWRESFSQVYHAYETMRRQNHSVDFDDMLKECEELLQNDPLQREYWQNRFSHILIDEFQDINYRQYCIVRLLAQKHKNVFAVGDDDQAIYGFRGARPACMKLFEKEFHADRILLGTNYRSHQDIVEASLMVIKENRDRFPKCLTACEANRRDCREGNYGKSRRVQIHEFREAPEQQQYMIDRCKNRTAGESYAILFRTNLSMHSMAARLTAEGIPFSMKEKSRNIYEHFILRDIMSYLRIAYGTADRADYLRVINKPFRGVSREAFVPEASMHALETYYSGKLSDAGCAPDSYRLKTYDAVRLFARQMEFARTAKLSLAVTYIRKACGYDKYLFKSARIIPESGNDWNEVLEWATEDAGQYQNLQEWEEAQTMYREALQKREKEGRREGIREEKNDISLLTVHASKGLEFDHVWIPDCNERIFPHGNTQDVKHCEEERRIFYVAMTRAKKDLELLCLTGTRERPRFPSRFLIPLDRYRHQ